MATGLSGGHGTFLKAFFDQRLVMRAKDDGRVMSHFSNPSQNFVRFLPQSCHLVFPDCFALLQVRLHSVIMKFFHPAHGKLAPDVSYCDTAGEEYTR